MLATLTEAIQIMVTPLIQTQNNHWIQFGGPSAPLPLYYFHMFSKTTTDLLPQCFDYLLEHRRVREITRLSGWPFGQFQSKTTKFETPI